MMNLEMGSRRGFGHPSGAVTSDPFLKGKGKADVSNSSVDQLLHGDSGMNVTPTDDDGWQEYGKKSKNRNKKNASKQWVPQHSTPKAWGHADTLEKLGMRTDGGTGKSSNQQKYYGRGYNKQLNRNDNDSVVPHPVIPPPLKNGWGWNSREASSRPSDDGVVQKQSAQAANNQAFKSDEVDDDDDDDESDDIDDSDDELMSDDFDSDESQKSHETRKKSKWFKELFQCLDNLTTDQINEPERQWHCPACQNGPGAIDWYRGLQPLITHAKTKRSKRVKLHRELAEILDEELKRRGTSAVPAGEVFGKWKGLDKRADKDIVWPPMVVILNTKLDKDDNDNV